MEDIIIRMVSRAVVPFILVYGMYALLHEHLTPGGTFAAGGILAASMILYALAFNLEKGSKKLSYNASLVIISVGICWFTLVGLNGIYRGANFLANKAAGFKLGVPGELMSGGIIKFIPLGAGLMVALVLITLFYSLIEEVEGDTHD